MRYKLLKVFNCNICDFETKKERGLNLHKKQRMGQAFMFELCGETFKTKRDFD